MLHGMLICFGQISEHAVEMAAAEKSVIFFSFIKFSLYDCFVMYNYVLF